MSVIQIETAREIIISKVTEFNQEYISYHNFTILKYTLKIKVWRTKDIMFYLVYGISH